MEPNFETYPEIVEQLITAALNAADPAMAVRKHLRRDGHQLDVGDFHFDLDSGRVYMVSIGKAAISMGMAAAEILADDLEAGILVAKKQDRGRQEEAGEPTPEEHPPNIRILYGSHPVSDEDSVRAAMAVTELLADTTADDLVICLISGGASAIHAYPLVPLTDWQQLNQKLLESGCTINELNRVRRPLDRVKGGGLARYAAPAACVSLILSDVIGNPLDVIASGPTELTRDSPADVLAVLQKYGISSQLESSAWERIAAVLDQEEEQLLPDPAGLHSVIVGDLRQAAEASLVAAAQLGFLTQVLTTRLQGEAREVGRVVAAIARDLPPRRCLIMGGETTVTVRGLGEGGRNQELALAAAIDLEGCSTRAVVACFDTDGEDGPTEAAGAIVTADTVSAGRSYKLEAASYLDDNDSHTYFSLLDTLGGVTPGGTRSGPGTHHLIRTGPTGTNVNDLIFILTFPKPPHVDEKHVFGPLEYR